VAVIKPRLHPVARRRVRGVSPPLRIPCRSRHQRPRRCTRCRQREISPGGVGEAFERRFDLLAIVCDNAVALNFYIRELCIDRCGESGLLPELIDFLQKLFVRPYQFFTVRHTLVSPVLLFPGMTGDSKSEPAKLTQDNGPAGFRLG